MSDKQPSMLTMVPGLFKVRTGRLYNVRLSRCIKGLYMKLLNGKNFIYSLPSVCFT